MILAALLIVAVFAVLHYRHRFSDALRLIDEQIERVKKAIA